MGMSLFLLFLANVCMYVILVKSSSSVEFLASIVSLVKKVCQTLNSSSDTLV